MKKMIGKTAKVLLMTVFVLVCVSIVSMKTAKAAIDIISPSEGDRIEMAGGSGSTSVMVNVRPCTVFPYTQVPGGSLKVPRYLCARITLNGEKIYYSRFQYDSTAIIQFELPIKAPGTYRLDFRTDIPVQQNVSGGIEFHYQLKTEEEFLAGTPEASVSFVAYRPGEGTSEGSGEGSGGNPAAGSGSSAENEKVSLSKLKSVKLTAVSAKKLKITWKKLSSKDKKKIKQIQVQVSTDKNFTTIVKEKFLKNSKTSWTIPGLKKNTKYFVRIRAYTKDGNTIYVSKWVTKNKKTKKK